MGWFSDDSAPAQAYNEYQDPQPHQASITHEMLGAAAAFEATRAYENHCAKKGHPDNHALAKELLAGLAGGIIDREVETRGLDMAAHMTAKDSAMRHIDESVTETTYNNYYNN